MAQVNLVNEQESVITDNDNIVVVKVIDTVRGGRSLDVTGFTPDLIKAGHVIIKETSTGEYKPMPVQGDGSVETLGTITGGSSYTNGSYTNVALTGGAGSGATANITVVGGAVTTVVIVNKGTGYVAGNTLSASAATIGGTGSGFSVPVATADTEPSLYAALPGGHTYEGINIATIRKERPFAGIMLRGTVNPAAAPYPMAGILSAFKTANGHILFSED